MSLNVIVIQGRLTRDPELRRTGSGLAVASFSVAVERDFPNKETGEKETDFINCVAWRQTAEFIGKYFTKGSMIVVSGRLQIKKWTDDNGIKRTAPEIVVENVYFGGSKRDNASSESSNKSYTYGVPVMPTSDFAMMDDDDYAVLPF